MLTEQGSAINNNNNILIKIKFLNVLQDIWGSE